MLLVILSFQLSTVALANDKYDDYQSRCLSCHAGLKSDNKNQGPQLGGLSKDYILGQLHNFKKGRRGEGHQLARAMSDAVKMYHDEELNMLARWASSIKSKQYFRYSQAKNSDGYKLYKEKCKGCHNSMIGRFITGSPKLRNLDGAYIIRQLDFFNKGLRVFDQPTKHQLKMQTVVKSLNDEEFEALTHFITIASQAKYEGLDE